MTKPKIIFIHILKCGGTSMLHMLFDEYGVSEFHPVPLSTSLKKVEYPALRGVSALEWQNQINVNTAYHYGVIAGHYDWGLAKRLTQWTVVTLLRHPVEQIRSLYQFMLANRDALGEIVDWMREVGFVKWVQSQHAQTYLNAQTTYLSGHHVRDLNLAKQNLHSERVVFGILEYFEESILRWNKHFGWDMTMQHRNSASNVLELDDDTRAMVERLQQQDMVLYQSACDAFNKDKP